MINHYERVVIFCYPNGAGGKFLNNCLALNDQFVFSNHMLASQQLQGTFTVKNKVAYLDTKLNESRSQKTWNDLKLGCVQLTGLREDDYLKNYPEILSLRLNHTLQKIINANLWFGIVAHTTFGLEATLRFWPNAKVILFTNSENFLTARGQFDQNKDQWFIPRLNYWNVIKGADWPEVAPSNTEQFNLLDDFIKQELTDIHQGEIFQYFDHRKLMYDLFQQHSERLVAQLGNRVYCWDTDKSYQNLENFLMEFNKCRNWLRVPHPGNDTLTSYFCTWKYVIQSCR